MKIVKLKGGLGNQLFQYCFAIYLQNETGDEVKLDYSFYNVNEIGRVQQPRISNFNLQLQCADESEVRNACFFDHRRRNKLKYYFTLLLEIVFNRKYYFETSMVHKYPLSFLDHRYFDGYWQSWRLVDYVFPIIKNHFVPISLSKDTSDAIDAVCKCNSVFVGVRKGDYGAEKKKYGSFNLDYYLSAMRYIDEHVKDPVYYVFSDDVEWVKRNLDFGQRNIIYRDDKYITSDFEELQIMMNCKHSIITNSTFHWWGARFNDYDGKIVIAPQKWFFDNKKIDIIPDNWVRIRNSFGEGV